MPEHETPPVAGAAASSEATDWLSVAEAARRLRVDRSRVYAAGVPIWRATPPILESTTRAAKVHELEGNESKVNSAAR
ncbi:MAG TPA: hypothetical protein VKV73_23380 [Chloroflexota bacterium]|nr:hypothetical protein [Chloroflexota bacterium]